MDVIAGRKTQGEIRGEILVNGFPKDQRTWARVVGYVEQNDIHTPQVSHNAKLRGPSHYGHWDHGLKQQRMLESLEIVLYEILRWLMLQVVVREALAFSARLRLPDSVSMAKVSITALVAECLCTEAGECKSVPFLHSYRIKDYVALAFLGATENFLSTAL